MPAVAPGASNSRARVIHEDGRRPSTRLGLAEAIVLVGRVEAAGRDFDTVPLLVELAAKGIVAVNEMAGSNFYQGIFPGKQLGDDLSSLTVPLLSHL